MKNIPSLYLAALLSVTSQGNAALVSLDWQTIGDQLITRDTVSGLDWLDLTETVGVSYQYVNSQLGEGGEFEGFRFATQAEAVALWANFGVDLSADASRETYGEIDPGIEYATSFIGNTIDVYGSGLITHSANGMTADPYIFEGTHYWVGAYYRPDFSISDPSTTNFYAVEDWSFASDSVAFATIGSYLVKPVPLPASVWFFGTGLIGLLGFVKQK